jgi:hypothetical protein
MITKSKNIIEQNPTVNNTPKFASRDDLQVMEEEFNQKKSVKEKQWYWSPVPGHELERIEKL